MTKIEEDQGQSTKIEEDQGRSTKKEEYQGRLTNIDDDERGFGGERDREQVL